MPPSESGTRRPRSSTSVAFIVAASMAIVVGVALLIASSSFAVTLAGTAALVLGAVILVALVFLLIGEGEDQYRRENPRG